MKKIMIIFLMFLFIVPITAPLALAGDNNNSIGATVWFAKGILSLLKDKPKTIKNLIEENFSNMGYKVNIGQLKETIYFSDKKTVYIHDATINEERGAILVAIDQESGRFYDIAYPQKDMYKFDAMMSSRNDEKEKQIILVFKDIYKIELLSAKVIQNEDSENP